MKLVAFEVVYIALLCFIMKILGDIMRLLTYKELGKELSLSVRYLQKCVQEESLPVVHFGRAVRFDPVRVAEWVNSRYQKSNNPKVKEVA